MKKNNAGFIQIILVLGVIILVGVAYSFGTQKIGSNTKIVLPTPTPTPASSETLVKEETSNWKTYTNTKYNFEIKYPVDRKIEESENKIFEFVAISQEYPKPNIQIFPTNKDFLDNNPYIDSDITKQEKIKFNGIDTTHLVVTSEIGLAVDYLLVGKNNQYFIISYENYDPLQSQILSTFKFTK